MRFTLPALALLAAAGIIAFTPMGVTSGVAVRGVDHVAAEAGWFGPAALKRLTSHMDAAELTLAQRFDPTPHADNWDRSAAWATLDLDQAPALPIPALDQDEARVINAVLPSGPGSTPAPSFILTGSAAEQGRAALCMSQAIYYEAALEPIEGQQAVAQTILNRVRHPDFPKSVCGVVYQGASAPGCQFSFACDGSRDRAPIEPYWSRAKGIAQAALGGYVDSAVGTATYYHANYVLPVWAPQLVKIGQFGSQLFYRYPGPLGGAQALSAHYGGGELAVSMEGPPASVIAAMKGLGVQPAPPPPAGVVMPGQLAPTQLASADPLRPRAAGEIVFGRRVPTQAEIARINTQLADLSAQTPPAAKPATSAATAPF